MTSAAPNIILLWCVVGAYLAIVTAAGVYYSRYVKTADAYFRAESSIPWWAAGIAIYKANFTAYTFVAIASLVYVDGMAGLLLETGPAFAFLVAAYVFATRWHRLNLTSPPEYMEARFNVTTRRVFAVFGIATTFVASGMRLYAVCKLVESVMGLPLIPTILIAGAVMILYTMLGGLSAVVVTDVLQFMILFLAVVPLFITCCSYVFFDVGWQNFVARIPEGYGSFPHPEHGRTAGWLIVFWISYLFDYNGDWGVIQMMCSTPDEKQARKAALLAFALGIPHAFLLLGPVFVARVLWANEIADPAVMSQAETAYGKIALKLLPVGMIGVVAAAMLAATMSTLTVAWSVRSTSLVNDLYVRFFRPRAGDVERIFAGRVAVLLIGGIAVAVALTIATRSTGLFSLAQTLVGFVVVPLILPLLAGLLLRRMHQWSGVASFFIGVLFAAINLWAPFLFGRDTPLPFEAEILISIALGLAVMIGSGWLRQSAADRQRAADFLATLSHPRPARTGDLTVPAPLGILSTLSMLVGFLVLALAAVPQSLYDRVLTFGSGAVLLAIAGAMRRAHRKYGQHLAP